MNMNFLYDYISRHFGMDLVDMDFSLQQVIRYEKKKAEIVVVNHSTIINKANYHFSTEVFQHATTYCVKNPYRSQSN